MLQKYYTFDEPDSSQFSLTRIQVMNRMPYTRLTMVIYAPLVEELASLNLKYSIQESRNIKSITLSEFEGLNSRKQKHQNKS